MKHRMLKPATLPFFAAPMDPDQHAHHYRLASTRAATGCTTSLHAGLDGMVSLWDIDLAALTQPSPKDDRERRLELVGSLALLEDLQDYFCYAQLRAQGEDISQPRNVPGTTVTSRLILLMAAVALSGHSKSLRVEEPATWLATQLIMLLLEAAPMYWPWVGGALTGL
jgi:hypothetical protein